VQVEEEQENLRVAATYFSNDPRVKVPGVLPFSTRNVTCMEFIDGVKVTDAFPGRANDRARLARRLSDLLTFDVLFAKVPMALFHGDPHAGNVFHVGTNGGPLSGRDADALRIALLDWGLAAELTLEDRERVTQLMLGLRLGHAKRIANNISAFVDLKGEPGESESLLVLAEGFLAERERNGLFEGLDELLTILAREGYAVHYRAAMFIKAQLTIAGIMKELDPSFDQSEYLMDRMQGQVMRELPKRLLRTVWFPAWNSHDYRSLMSNEDVKDVQVQQVVGAFAAVGKGLWRAVSLRWLF
jgi:ubiquinone biosynthesis protein